MKAKRVKPKNCYEIGDEWNVICESRHLLIENGKDLSLTQVTAPFVLSTLKLIHPYRVLDVGCGTGYLTNEIAKMGIECTGIDLSSKSISIAKKRYESDKVQFFTNRTKEFTVKTKYDACVANMVFMDDPEWEKSIYNIRTLTNDPGYLILTITHPWFWPKYWGYESEPWFDYNSEIFIEHDFGTTLSDSIGTTTHIHRPLSHYIKALQRAGYTIEVIDELIPQNEMPDKYEKSYPKFLAFVCRNNCL